MNTLDLTEWFPASVKPEREGAFETRLYAGEPETYQYWKGDCWGPGDTTPYLAEMATIWAQPSMFQDVEWRGLATESQPCSK